jgi:hypothetical protein
VGGVDATIGMNLLHYYVAYAAEHDVRTVMVRLRTMRDVYGFSLVHPTSDGQTLSMLASRGAILRSGVASRGAIMRVSVERVLEEDVFAPRHLALAAAQALRALPPLAVHMIGRYARLPMLGAHELDERLRGGRKSSQ